jgi:hypothetical protein
MLVLTAYLDCPECEAVFEGVWKDDSLSVQDMAEAPVADQTCPNGHVMAAEEYSGWMFRSEAG